MAKRLFLIDLPHRSAPLAELLTSLRGLEALPEDTYRKQEMIADLRATIADREAKSLQAQAREP